jgi:hypothetical protein
LAFTLGAQVEITIGFGLVVPAANVSLTDNNADETADNCKNILLFII